MITLFLRSFGPHPSRFNLQASEGRTVFSEDFDAEARQFYNSRGAGVREEKNVELSWSVEFDFGPVDGQGKEGGFEFIIGFVWQNGLSLRLGGQLLRGCG